MSRPIVLAAASLAVLAATSTTAWAETRCEIDFGMIVQHIRPKASPVHQGPVGPSTHFGSHGQLVFGEDEVYLHHLPFLLDDPGRHPHNFQVLMRVSFVDEADQQAYLERRKLLPDALFTALPGPFNQDGLKEIFENGAAGQELGPVELFDEHFENSPPPQPFLTAPMIVDEVVQFAELLPQGPPAEELRYLIVDGGHEAFLVHELSSPPDFDQVLKVSLSYENSGRFEDSFDGGVLRIVGAGNREDERLSAGDTRICSAHDGTRRMPFDVPVTVERETYCEAGELSAVASSPTFEGKRACRD
jgi:hypothetical protein